MEIHTPLDLGAVTRGRRRALGLSQAKVAEAAGVSRPWLAQFESGKPTVELGRVLAVLATLELHLDVRTGNATLPEAELDLDALMEDYNREQHERD
ncbi:helix-turn-helix protein [Kribbella antiqua]|uniref:Helix-turn-helix protein n=1 Tax=Kribbella antiqua TaxID=2512217 RepID=A0A4R2ISE7_9ACTN|nr:helix-turn-helix domain-containing protein [Kribbella antiqua]TCO48234.1 helix-turn-helix protein [Kribbella antiqua]